MKISKFCKILLLCLINTHALSQDKRTIFPIKDNLFSNGKKDIFFQLTVGVDVPNDFLAKLVVEPEYVQKAEKGDYYYLYRNYLERRKLENSEKIFLRNFIDQKSWQRVSSHYYIDSDHVYYHLNEMDGGGLFVVDNLDPNKLLFYADGKWNNWNKIKNINIERHYVSDGKKIYYRTHGLENADFDSFRMMQISPEEFYPIASDKNGVWEGSSRWQLEDYKILYSNIFDENGRLLNNEQLNLDWISSLNKILKNTEFKTIDIPEK